MKQHNALLVALVGLVTLLACSADTRDKLGTDGEVCYADVDCADGLLCIDNICTGSERAGGCDILCDTLAACGEDVSSCDTACTEETALWREEAFDSFIECVPTNTCGDIAIGALDDCLPEAPAGRLQTCSDLVTQLNVVCGGIDGFRESCEVAAATFPNTAFDAIRTCDAATCDSFEQCRESVW